MVNGKGGFMELTPKKVRDKYIRSIALILNLPEKTVRDVFNTMGELVLHDVCTFSKDIIPLKLPVFPYGFISFTPIQYIDLSRKKAFRAFVTLAPTFYKKLNDAYYKNVDPIMEKIKQMAGESLKNEVDLDD